MNNADVTVYDLQKWLSPLWKGNTVYAETAFILKNALGEDGMSAYTLAVTYEHEPDDYYAVTAGKSGKFPRTLEKLKNGQNIKTPCTAERNLFRSALFLQITDGNRGGVFRGGKISRLYLKAIDIRTEKSYNDKRVLPARRENGREQ